jgi:hypothetical protein
MSTTLICSPNVEHENLSSASKSAGLKNQLHRFGNRHEVAARISGCVTVTGPPARICRRNVGTTDPRLPRTFSESHRHKIPVMLRRGMLNDLLGNSLRRAHHARRAHSLVGRNQDEMLDIRLDCCINNVARSCDVVSHRLEHVVFHQRNVLVRSGVEDSVWTMLLENVEDAVAIADVRDDRHDVDIREAERQLLEDVEDRVFAV